MYTTAIATINSMPMLRIESWKTLAVPWNTPVMLPGRFALAAASISSVAWPSEIDRHNQQHAHVAHRVLENLGRSLEYAGDAPRQIRFGGGLDFIRGLAERDRSPQSTACPCCASSPGKPWPFPGIRR